MARLKLRLPESKLFETKYLVVVTDLNYGGHVGNDRFLGLAHEARVRFFKSLEQNELSFFGTGIIMSEAAVEYKQELLHGDMVNISVFLGDESDLSFELYYHFTKNDKTAAIIKTTQIYFDYSQKQIVKNTLAQEKLKGQVNELH